MRLLFILACTLVFTSCVTERKVRAYKNLDKVCADMYPPKETSETNTVYIPANNVDVSHIIDSVNQLANDDLEKLRTYAIYARDSISDQCADLIDKALLQSQKLKTQLADLQGLYKKCVADTVKTKTTVKVRDMAREHQYQRERDEERAAHKKTQQKLDKTTRQKNWFKGGFSLLIAGAVVLVYLRLKP